jgi:hypothetical protein
MVSSAEKALQQSTGRRGPVICWGCGNKHVYKDCPDKNDPQVVQNFQQNLQKWLQGKGYVKRNPNNFRQDGYPTKHSVVLLNSINDPAVSAEQREAHMHELAVHVTTELDSRRGNSRRTGKGKKRRNPAEGYSSYSFADTESLEDPKNEDHGEDNKECMVFYSLPSRDNFRRQTADWEEDEDDSDDDFPTFEEDLMPPLMPRNHAGDPEDISCDDADGRALIPSNSMNNESVPGAMYQYCDDVIYPNS